MKAFLFLVFLSFTFISYSQEMSSINSGAFSSNTLIYSVGEIFVVPVSDPDEASSGLLGAISRIEFFVEDVENGIQTILYTNELKAYPNPTSSSLFFDLNTEGVKHINIYDASGRFIISQKIISNKVDLSDLETGTYLIKTDNPNFKALTIIKK